MGSWFSSPNGEGAGAGSGYLRYVRRAAVSKQFAARLQQLKDSGRLVDPNTQEGEDAYCIRELADWALRHYNSNHAGPEFRLPDRPTADCVSFTSLDLPTTDLKAACVGFREDLWYHINFSARQTDDDEHILFAELRYGRCSNLLTVETCTILEEPLDHLTSSCALCPSESNILHPNAVQLGCGKEGQEKEFFRERRAWNGHTKELFSKSNMLQTPFFIGGNGPRYRLD
ncbi:hypothetical protein VPH35_033106 [Triticum aestivum]|uniref:uncharacterized protein n=1 Tax=Triticum aestivum TaxID=4565 RepID=UPI00162D793D|nr:uncharacterized protein LOC123042876 [Triticum aestivum]